MKKLLDQGPQSVQYTFSADDQSQATKAITRCAVSNDGTDLSTAVTPKGFPMTTAPERRKNLPRLGKDLLALIQVTAEAQVADAEKIGS